jgi:hypothetical protein
MSKIKNLKINFSLFISFRSNLDSVWNNNDDSKDQFTFQSQNHQMLPPSLMFSQSLTKNNSKQQQQPK